MWSLSEPPSTCKFVVIEDASAMAKTGEISAEADGSTAVVGQPERHVVFSG
jgi:hypothetical protein